ncbi:MAG: glycosyltransferase [Paracoccaceae bacterium]
MTERPPRHVLYVQPNSEVGGSDIALARTIEAMAPTGQRSSVVLPGDGPLVGRLRAAGAEVHFLPMLQLRTLPSPVYQARYLALLGPTVWRLSRLIRDLQPDLVHSNSLFCLYGAFAAALARTPHLWHVREMAPSVPVLTWAYAVMVRRLSRTILAMTDACLEPLFAVPPRQAVVMPDALDADAFRAGMDPQRLRRDLGLAADVQIVGTAARLDPWKGIHVFIDAAAQVAQRYPKAVFVIAGGAPQGLEQYEVDLRAQVARLGLGGKVMFLGWRYRLQDMADVMAGFDIFCHTAVRPEPFGLVLIEAMSVATPIIAARAGGPKSILQDGVSGLLTTPGDAQDLARAIMHLLASPDRAKALGAAGQARQAQEFSVPLFVSRLSAIYDLTLRRP